MPLLQQQLLLLLDRDHACYYRYCSGCCDWLVTTHTTVAAAVIAGWRPRRMLILYTAVFVGWRPSCDCHDSNCCCCYWIETTMLLLDRDHACCCCRCMLMTKQFRHYCVTFFNTFSAHSVRIQRVHLNYHHTVNSRNEWKWFLVFETVFAWHWSLVFHMYCCNGNNHRRNGINNNNNNNNNSSKASMHTMVWDRCCQPTFLVQLVLIKSFEAINEVWKHRLVRTCLWSVLMSTNRCAPAGWMKIHQMVSMVLWRTWSKDALSK